MATYGEIQTNLADYLSRADLGSQIQSAIKKAIKHYERESFWFTDSNTSFLTVSGTQSYTLSLTNGYAAIHQVMINRNGSRYEVRRTGIDELNAIDATNSTGEPSLYAEQNGLLVFYPEPNSTFTVSVNYAAKYATLSAVSDTNNFTLYADDLIEARAEWFVRRHKMRDYAGAVQSKNDEMEALQRLRGESEVKITSGRIKPTTF